MDTVSMTLRLPREIHERLRQESFDKRVSITSLINDALSQEPHQWTDADRSVMRNAVAVVLSNASNFPERVQSRLLGQNMGPLIDRVTDAALDAAEKARTVT